MSSLMVWGFGHENGAIDAERALTDLDARGEVTVGDGALTSWPARRPRPHSRELENVARVAPLGGDFWGLLFGTLFVLPALNADQSPQHSGLHHLGLDPGALDVLAQAIIAGTSALLVVLPNDCTETLVARLGIGEPLICCRLSEPFEAGLRGTPLA